MATPGDYKYIAQCVIKSETFGVAYWLPPNVSLYGVWRAGNEFELIPTIKMETRRPVEIYFSREYAAICSHCGVMTVWSRKTWKFCEQFLRLFWKTIPLKLSLLRGSRTESARAIPHIWLTLFQITFKSVHFRRSSCQTREDRFRPVKYFQ